MRKFSKKIEKGIRYNPDTDTYYVQFTFKDEGHIRSFPTLEGARTYRDTINAQKLENKIKHDMLVLKQEEEREIAEFFEKNKAYPYNALKAMGLSSDLPVDIEERFEEALNGNIVIVPERVVNCIYDFYKEGKTLQAIADEQGVTRERIRQVLCTGLNKIKHFLFTYDTLLELKRRKEFDEKDLADRHAMREELIKAYRETGVITDKMEFEFGTLLITSDSGVVENYGIEELDLSIRSYNCLKRAHILKLSDLVVMTKTDLYKIRNMGKKSLKEIVDKLEMVGIHLKD